ncbi:MAG: PD40 domain-containing protein, partial [Campylobacterales bacterium]|nr:PD40 domain-containing protein [Campylobacterales bacterium]
MIKRRYLAFILILFALSLTSCEEKAGVVFSYRAMLSDTYKLGTGGSIPLTIEKGVELGGDVSKNGNYFFYTSNRELGNYDIYMRSLQDVNIIRLTNHPSKDYSPKISPNGKYLLYVTRREDPRGDIFKVKISASKIVKNGTADNFDKDSQNLTLITNEKGVILSYKDSEPSWSTSGDLITFTSNRGGSDDIWVMEDNGKNPRQITSKGGSSPIFSKDDNEILFISYRDGNSGDLYTIDVKTKQVKRLTQSSSIKLSTFYGETKDDIYAVVINSDTNGDGKINLSDNSVISKYNKKTKKMDALTSSEISCMSAQYLPFYPNKDYNGIIVYSEQRGENIDIKIMRDSGIIPKRKNDQLQFELALVYEKEQKNMILAKMAYQHVVNMYGSRRDVDSQFYVAQAIYQLYKIKKRAGDDTKDVIAELSSAAKNKNEYAAVLKDIIGGSSNSVEKILLAQIAKYQSLKSRFVPYLIEELAGYYADKNRNSMALNYFYKIQKDYPKYQRMIYVEEELAKIIEFDQSKSFVSKSDEYLLRRGKQYQRTDVQKIILNRIFSVKNLSKRLAILNSDIKLYEKNYKLLPLLHYGLAKTYMSQGKPKEAMKEFSFVIKKAYKGGVIYYRSNILLGDLYLQSNKTMAASESYYNAISNYNPSSNEDGVVDKLKWLINFYESAGAKYSKSGKYSLALKLYEKYRQLSIRIKLIDGFEDFYEKYASRAHILFVNTKAVVAGKNGILDAIKIYQDRLPKARMDFDKSYIYGLAYAYGQLGLAISNDRSNLDLAGSQDKDMIKAFADADEQVDWVLFIDGSYTDAYLRRSWIHQLMDVNKRSDESLAKDITKIFGDYLLESNVDFLTKGLSVNNSVKYPEREGDLQLNIANSYFLLENYPRALNHYLKVRDYKSKFSSATEEGLFHFHLAYCMWQNGDITGAKKEMLVSQNIYGVMSGGTDKITKSKRLIFMKYFALFDRFDNRYKEAINWYQQILRLASGKSLGIDRSRYYQEIANCYEELGDYSSSLDYLKKSTEI